MKIAILVPRLSGGGAEYVAKAWYSAVESLGHEVTTILTHDEVPAGPMDQRLHSLSRARTGFVHHIISLGCHIRTEQYRVVISLMPYSNLVSILASRFIRPRSRPSIAISEHTVHSGVDKSDRLSHRVQWWMAKKLYRHAEACVAVSHPVAAELGAACGIPASRMWVLPNPAAEGIQVRSGRPAALAQSKVRGDSLPTLTVVVPSRLVAQKRLELAVLSAQILRQQKINARIELFGVGPEEDRLRQLASSLGVPCVFRGWVEKWYEHIPDDGVVMLPSAVEGFGNVLVEAAAKSVAVVVSSRALGVADACIPDITAKLITGDAPNDFAEGLIAAGEMVLPDLKDWLARFTNPSVAANFSRLLVALQDS